MTIRVTGRAEFILRLSLHSDLERLVGKEVEWFAVLREASSAPLP
jgi:hypothetical protein